MNNKILEAVFILIAIALSLYLLYEIKQVITYIVISTIFALIGRPIVKLLNTIHYKKIKMPNTVSVIITLFVFLSVVTAITLATLPLIVEQSDSLSKIHLSDLENNYIIIKNHIDKWLSQFGIYNFNPLKEKNFKELIDFSFVPDLINILIETMSGISMGLLSITFITFFLLKDKDIIQQKIISLAPERREKKITRLIFHIKNSLSDYLVGLSSQVLILFILYTLMLYISGISNFIIIALLGALFNLVPYIGPLIGYILMISLSITGNITTDFNSIISPMISTITIGYILIQLLDNFITQPYIFSKTANAHPLEIFLIILIAANLGGVIGMIIAVPSYTIIRIIFNEFNTEFQAIKLLTKKL